MKYAGAEQTAGRTRENRTFSGLERVQEVCCSMQYNGQNKGRVRTVYILYISMQFSPPVLVMVGKPGQNGETHFASSPIMLISRALDIQNKRQCKVHLLNSI